MNRRNVLLGLGTIVAGGGAALGSGAFSQAEAQRSVNVSIEGDASGLLRPTVEHEKYEGVKEGGSEDGDSAAVNMTQVEFVGINDESVFHFDNVLTVGLRDGSGDGGEVTGTFKISISTTAGGVAVYDDSFPENPSRDDTGDDVTDVTLGTISVSDGQKEPSVSAGIAINTNPAEEDGDRFAGTLTNDDNTGDITITAKKE